MGRCPAGRYPQGSAFRRPAIPRTDGSCSGSSNFRVSPGCRPNRVESATARGWTDTNRPVLQRSPLESIRVPILARMGTCSGGALPPDKMAEHRRARYRLAGGEPVRNGFSFRAACHVARMGGTPALSELAGVCGSPRTVRRRYCERTGTYASCSASIRTVARKENARTQSLRNPPE